MECVRIAPDKFECYQISAEKAGGGGFKTGHDWFPEWIQYHIEIEPVYSRWGDTPEMYGYRHFIRTPQGHVPASDFKEGSWFVGSEGRVWHYSKERFESAFKVIEGGANAN